MTLNTKSNRGILLILLLSLLSFAEEVCKIAYQDYPAKLKGKTIEAPANTVSLSEAVRIKKADDSSVVIMNTPALMFVLDNSGSMYIPHRSDDDPKQYKLALDPDGNRFSVTEAMIDSLYIQDPNAEVGLIVFGSKLHFDKTEVVTKYIDPDDPFNFANAAFVTFLQLNKEYTEKSKAGTGYEILKYYLETEELRDRIVFKDENDTTKIILDTVVTFRMLKNITNTAIDFDSGTDITRAFKAVTQSLNHTDIEKKLQYTVFFSDGIPSSGGMEMWDFVKGQGIPTTFTIFFHPQKVAPDSLISMNENIKNNNYSTNNSNSELWAFDNSGHDELLQFMIENVLNKIKGEITTEPVEITINGKTNGKWIDGAFTFEEQFPLVAEKSDFTFDIQYNIITKKSDNTTSVDTVHDEIAFFVQRVDSPQLLDSILIERWDRSISVSDDDSLISVIAEGTEQLEIHFTEKKVDCNYQYEEVEVTIESRNFGDQLTLKLHKDDIHNFSNRVSLDFREDGEPIDDTLLQLSPDDELSIFFQNKRLPLDTLTHTIATNITYRVQFQEAIFFDENGDGSVDKITLPFKANFDLTASHINELIAALELPAYRKFTIKNTILGERELHLEVREALGKLQTSVSSEDVITVKSKEIEFFTLSGATLKVVDSMAPVLDLQTVSIVENINGASFSVRFSEPVAEITSVTPLRFYDSGNNSYKVELTVEEPGESEYRFLVTSTEQDIQTGDSVHITVTGMPVSDLKGNSQQISTNVKRRISTSAVVEVDRAAYFDEDADGHVDCIRLFYSSLHPLSGSDAKVLFEKALHLPSFRKFDTRSVSLTEQCAEFRVTEGTTGIQTYCSKEDTITISEQESNNLLLVGKSLKVIDSIAPVLLDKKIEMVRSTKGAVIVAHFSEEIEDIASAEPLRFYHNSEPYTVRLNEKTAVGVRYEFTVTENAHRAQSGDSVQIHSSASITDLTGSTQHNENNIKREMIVKDELELKSATYFDKNSDGHVDGISIDYTLSCDSLEIDPELLLNALELPEHRKLKILRDSITITNRTIYLPVLEEIEEINTACTDNDILRVRKTAIGTYLLSAASLPIIDSMAPVISAEPVLYLSTMSGETPDSIRLTFSEEVSSIESDTPLRFFHKGKAFLGELEVVDHAKRNFLFSVISFEDSTNELYKGDSVNIHEAVYDIVGNEQNNPGNIKRPLDVKIVLPQIAFTLRAITPFIVEETVIPDRIMSLIDDKSEFELSESDSGFLGDPIMLKVTPPAILEQLDFTIEANITILDKVGNVILPLHTMQYLDELQALIYLWNGKNRLGRTVGNDCYLLICQARLTFADGQSFEAQKEILLATQKGDK